MEDEGAWWYESQSEGTKRSWDSLTKALCREFQEKESYQVIMSQLNLMRQRRNSEGVAAISVREYATRLKEFGARILRSQRKTPGVKLAVVPDVATVVANTASVDAQVLRSFIRGLIPSIQEIVLWKEPQTLEFALAWAQKNEDNVGELSAPDVVTLAVPTKLVEKVPVSVGTSIQSSSLRTQPEVIEDPAIVKLTSIMEEMKLYPIQDRQTDHRAKSPMMERSTPQRTVQFVTCHGYGVRGHYERDCPKKTKSNVPVPTTSGVKIAEIHMLERMDAGKGGPAHEIMMTKWDRRLADLEVDTTPYQKRAKSKKGEGPSRRCKMLIAPTSIEARY